ncbi:MAG: hypothetical protein AAFR65_15030 [Pseudomonadota bacterium]
MLDFISKPWVLVALFVATLAINVSFALGLEAAGGAVLDFRMNGDDAFELLNAMTAEQKSAHFWLTVVNDTAYPIAYTSLLAGIVWRFAGAARTVLIWPAIGGGIFDLMENTTQALALKGNEAFLGFKDVLTPVKFGLASVAVILALFFLLAAVVRRFASRNA